jgi:hypothetical protein
VKEKRDVVRADGQLLQQTHGMQTRGIKTEDHEIKIVCIVMQAAFAALAVN